jgi:ABC-2 type transport system ATP-binding protein
VSAESFAGLAGILDLSIDDGTLRCTVMGSLDGLVKAASRYEVLNLRSVETSLEEIFLAYYGSGEGTAADGAAKEAGHAAA